MKRLTLYDYIARGLLGLLTGFIIGALLRI